MTGKPIRFLIPILLLTGIYTAAQDGILNKKNQQYYIGRLNYFIKWKKIKYPLNLKFTRQSVLDDIEKFLRDSMDTTAKDFYGKKINKKSDIKVAADGVAAPDLPDSRQIKITTQYCINDDFGNISHIGSLGGHTHFSVCDAVLKGRKQYNALFRIDNKAYSFVNGLSFDLFLDMGHNRVMAMDLRKPWILYGFRSDFKGMGMQKMKLDDIRLRQHVLMLDERRFVAHNFRLLPQDCAIEVINVSGHKEREFFDYLPIDYVKYERTAFLGQTVCCTNGDGDIYIAFACPDNPYRVWRYNRMGIKQKVMGHYFFPAGVYEYPLEWAHMDNQKLSYYGIRRLCLIHNLLVMVDGKIIVCWSENRIARPNRGPDITKIYLDLYNASGKYLGRTPFLNGLPEYIDSQNRIYSRKATPSGKWKIVVSIIKT